jgi:hypothetical protein
MSTTDTKGAPALGAFASKLAEAIARRHLLTQIAERGESVPAQITRDSEAQIRAAELALVRARRTP